MHSREKIVIPSKKKRQAITRWMFLPSYRSEESLKTADFDDVTTQVEEDSKRNSSAANKHLRSPGKDKPTFSQRTQSAPAHRQRYKRGDEEEKRPKTCLLKRSKKKEIAQKKEHLESNQAKRPKSSPYFNTYAKYSRKSQLSVIGKSLAMEKRAQSALTSKQKDKDKDKEKARKAISMSRKSIESARRIRQYQEETKSNKNERPSSVLYKREETDLAHTQKCTTIGRRLSFKSSAMKSSDEEVQDDIQEHETDEYHDVSPALSQTRTGDEITPEPTNDAGNAKLTKHHKTPKSRQRKPSDVRRRSPEEIPDAGPQYNIARNIPGCNFMAAMLVTMLESSGALRRGLGATFHPNLRRRAPMDSRAMVGSR
ncbi:hypothetical protein QZH41_002444 [Actinostola sp. cb2023]|nr:hypothetical protein QZH41_002444 [Actinostola sp. cb2023]